MSCVGVERLPLTPRPFLRGAPHMAGTQRVESMGIDMGIGMGIEMGIGDAGDGGHVLTWMRAAFEVHLVTFARRTCHAWREEGSQVLRHGLRRPVHSIGTRAPWRGGGTPGLPIGPRRDCPPGQRRFGRTACREQQWR